MATMNIYTKIENITNFTESEKYFIDFIIHSSDHITNLTLSQLAKQSSVSTSTIYRVLEKLNLTGINELKLKISSEKNDYLKEKKDVDYNYPFEKSDTQHQIMMKLFSLYQQTLHSTTNLIDLEKTLKVVQTLYNAENILMIPSIGNYFMAESFQQNMLEIGVKVEIAHQPFYQHWMSCAAKKNDAVIIISYANKTPWLLDIVKDLSKKSIPTILISSAYEDQLSQYVDHHLYFASYENSEEKIASFSSRISLQFILDYLYACYFNRNYEDHLHYRINNYIDY